MRSAMGSMVTKKFRRDVERVSQDRIKGPIVRAFRRKFAPHLKLQLIRKLKRSGECE